MSRNPVLYNFLGFGFLRQRAEGVHYLILDVTRNTILMGEEKTMRLMELVCVVLIGFFLMTPASFAEEQSIRTGFWGGIDVGAGLLQQSFDDIEEDDTTFFLGFKAGYTINPHFRMGLELSGWLLEGSNVEDPSVGEGINQVFLIARYYPRQKSNLFAKIGGGICECLE